MITFDPGAIRWLAVVVAALATFFLGAVWYTALFGRKWVALNGYTEEQVKQMQARRPPPVFFGVMLGAYFLLAIVIAVLVTSFGVQTAGGGAMLGLMLWLGPAAAIAVTSYIANDKPLGVYLIDGSYQLVFLVMMGAILGGWR